MDRWLESRYFESGLLLMKATAAAVSAAVRRDTLPVNAMQAVSAIVNPRMPILQ